MSRTRVFLSFFLLTIIHNGPRSHAPVNNVAQGRASIVHSRVRDAICIRARVHIFSLSHVGDGGTVAAIYFANPIVTFLCPLPSPSPWVIYTGNPFSLNRCY